MGRFIDLRSDTVTRPTPEMREIMAKADVGDDVYGEDPTINRLEELAAEMVGMEAALYLPSGTMGNQVAVYAHTQHGDEVILEADSHIFYYEVAGAAVLAGVQTRPVPGIDGAMDPESVNPGREYSLPPDQPSVCREHPQQGWRCGGTTG